MQAYRTCLLTISCRRISGLSRPRVYRQREAVADGYRFSKTVILTGAQIPLSQLFTDAVDNLLASLAIAGHYLIPEVLLVFDNMAFRGNRCIKASSEDFHAFQSFNLPPIAEVGIDIGELSFAWYSSLHGLTYSHRTQKWHGHKCFARVLDRSACIKSFAPTSVRPLLISYVGSHTHASHSRSYPPHLSRHYRRCGSRVSVRIGRHPRCRNRDVRRRKRTAARGAFVGFSRGLRARRRPCQHHAMPDWCRRIRHLRDGPSTRCGRDRQRGRHDHRGASKVACRQLRAISDVSASSAHWPSCRTSSRSQSSRPTKSASSCRSPSVANSHPLRRLPPTPRRTTSTLDCARSSLSSLNARHRNSALRRTRLSGRRSRRATASFRPSFLRRGRQR